MSLLSVLVSFQIRVVGKSLSTVPARKRSTHRISTKFLNLTIELTGSLDEQP